MSRRERVAVACPSCSPSGATGHEVLATGGGRVTVRCTECGHVHKTPVPDEAVVERRVVVSQKGESFSATVEAPRDESVAVGEEFVLDTEEALMAVRITDLEVAPDRRVEASTVGEVTTFWTRAVDNVYVDVTLHPPNGSRDETKSIEIGVPGDHEFVVGETETMGGETFTIEGIHVRDDAHGYPVQKLDRSGDSVLAKDLKRLYARDESTVAWSAW